VCIEDPPLAAVAPAEIENLRYGAQCDRAMAAVNAGTDRAARLRALNQVAVIHPTSSVRRSARLLPAKVENICSIDHYRISGGERGASRCLTSALPIAGYLNTMAPKDGMPACGAAHLFEPNAL